MMMSAAAPDAFLTIPGTAADHLYREGSAKASFWEVLFGSRLALEKRTRVSALPDGTRMFDVPVASIEAALFESALRFMAAQTEGEAFGRAGSLISSKAVGLALIGLQPQGTAVASFRLHIRSRGGAASTPEVAEAFAKWFEAERSRLTSILAPFGFTPQ